MLLLSCAIQKTEGKLITDRIRQIISLGEEKWVRIRNWQAVGQFLFFSSLPSESPVSAGELEYFRLTWMKRMIQPTDLQQLVSYSLAGKRLGIFRRAAAGEIRVRRSDTIRYRYKDLKCMSEDSQAGCSWGDVLREKSMTWSRRMKVVCQTAACQFKSLPLYSFWTNTGGGLFHPTKVVSISAAQFTIHDFLLWSGDDAVHIWPQLWPHLGGLLEFTHSNGWVLNERFRLAGTLLPTCRVFKHLKHAYVRLQSSISIAFGFVHLYLRSHSQKMRLI